LVFVASSLRTQHYGERAKIGWLRIKIMCPKGVTFHHIFINYIKFPLLRPNLTFNFYQFHSLKSKGTIHPVP
jgi:hypothetical protein